MRRTPPRRPPFGRARRHGRPTLRRGLAELFPEYSRSRLATWSNPATCGGWTVPRCARAKRCAAAGSDADGDAGAPVSPAPRHPAVGAVRGRRGPGDRQPAGLVVSSGCRQPTHGTLVNALLFPRPGAGRDPARRHRPPARQGHSPGDGRGPPPCRPRPPWWPSCRPARCNRQYLAIVVGALVSGGTVDAPIDRHPRDRLRMAVRDDGREARPLPAAGTLPRPHGAGVPLETGARTRSACTWRTCATDRR